MYVCTGAADIEIAVTEYQRSLQQFHSESTLCVSHSRPLDPDVSTYVKLKAFAKEKAIKNVKGLREFDIHSVYKGEVEVEIEDLFRALPEIQQKDERRTVVVLGVPGSGKSITCLHVLKEVLDGNMYKADIRFVFLIRFRFTNRYSEKLSYRQLLLSHHGPSIPDKVKITEDQLWQYLITHQRQLLILMDGYDEAEGLGTRFNESNTITFTSLDEPHNVTVLLHNIIAGRVFPEAKVIVTSRLQCTEQLSTDAYHNRLVSLDTLEEGQLKMMIQKNLPSKPLLAESLFNYILEHPAINGLCRVPLHAKSMLDYVRWKHEDMADTSILPALMPKTLSSLYLVTDLKMIRACDRPLQTEPNLTDEEILSKKKEFYTKVCKLASQGIIGECTTEHTSTKVNQVFTEEDIRKVDLNISEVEESIVSVSQASVPSLTGPVIKKFLAFSHQTHQEHLTSLESSQVNFHLCV